MTHDEEMRRMVWAAIFANNLSRNPPAEAARVADICVKEYDDWVVEHDTEMEMLRSTFLEIHDEKTSDAVLDDMTFEEGVAGAIDFLMGTDSEQAQRIINVIEAKKGVTK